MAVLRPAGPHPARHQHQGPERRFRWAYGHYLIFASAAVVGAGLTVNADQVTHRAGIALHAAGAMVAVPAAVFLTTVGALHLRPRHRRTAPHRRGGALLLTAVLLLLAALSPAPALATGVRWRCWPPWSPRRAAGGLRPVE
ncbi:low temperature requirement protein A [Streptomyces sp. BE133]|uniref:low temperature requirement protein A n=1 Tax=Streptomyces sp. BE133 TaxID=3002523 RepID=UPI002E78C68E|nr:low temperature requirement protein A [Streptomyces sp. BE133]MEE1807778.1 low temperature requirement protein A [Streptomyces sp. BE133]